MGRLASRQPELASGRQKLRVAKRPVEDRERSRSDRPSAKGIPQPANQTPVLISAASLRVTFKHEINETLVKTCKSL